MDYKSLKNIVLHHDKLYYDLGDPVLEDAEYDQLYDQLVEQEKIQNWKDSDSPTLRITAATGKVKHPFKLYSLRKVYDSADIDFQYSLELPKLDGVNLSVKYVNSSVNLVLTRGDGIYGESVAHLSRVIKGIPTKCNSDYVFVGEVLTDNVEVENFRNYVAGALGLKSAIEAESRNLCFVVHDVLGMEVDYLDRMAYARNKGFRTVDVGDYSKYPQDGVVYRVKDYATEQSMGYTSKYPRFAVALKKKEHFSGITYLKDIEWAVGRSNVVTPVAIVDPIVLDSATVSRVILHNIDFVEQHGLRRGDMILIERRITPQFVKVVEHSEYEPFSIADAKAALNCEITKRGPKLFVDDNDGFRLVEYFVKTLGIKGLGPAGIRKMDITHPSEIFKIKDWSFLGKNGEKIAVELSRPKEYALVLGALGIPNVGVNTAAAIVEHIPKFEDLHTIETTPIKNIGPVVINSILSWLEVNYDWVVELPYKLEADPVEVEVTNTRKIAVSGKLDMTKEELGNHLKKYGFVVSGSVTKDCYALITGGEESLKTKQAAKYGVPIYNYWNTKTIILKGMF